MAMTVLEATTVYKRENCDPVYTAPDLHGHDIKLNGLKTSVARKFMIILRNLIKTTRRKSVCVDVNITEIGFTQNS